MALLDPQTETAVANQSLSLIKQPQLIDVVADTTKAGRTVRLHYAPVRDALLRRYMWNFAEARALIEALADKPAFGWDQQYAKPADCLAVREVHGWSHNDWKVSGQVILARVCPPLKLVYTRRIAEPGLWDALFRNVFVNSLAAAIGPDLSAEEDRIQMCAQAASAALLDAFGIDALEGVDNQEAESDYLTARNIPVIAWDPMLRRGPGNW